MNYNGTELELNQSKSGPTSRCIGLVEFEPSQLTQLTKGATGDLMALDIWPGLAGQVKSQDITLSHILISFGYFYV